MPRLIHAWLLVAALGLSACVSRPPLQDEDRILPHRDLVAADRALDDRFVRIAVNEPGEPSLHLGLRIVRARGEPRHTIVFMPGVMADHATWRFVTAPLAEDHDLVLIDPVGVGRSDCPPPTRNHPERYTPEWAARHAARALRTLCRSLPDERRFVLVGHSLGSTVVLRLLGHEGLRGEFDDVVSRVDRAVLLAPADVIMDEIDPHFMTLVETTDLEVDVGGLLGLVRQRVEQGVYDTCAEPERHAFHQDAEELLRILFFAETRHAAQAMLLRFVPLDATGRRPDPKAVAAVQAQYARIDVPCLLVWGAMDDTLPISIGERLEGQIPGATLLRIPSAKHSPHHERPLEVVRAIREGAPR